MKPTLDLKRAVYAWLIPVRYPSNRLGESLSWLDRDMRDQANDIYCDDNRELLMESHLWLRRLLSAATGVAPPALRFDRGESGRPTMVRSSTKVPEIFFDVSYTYSCIAVALSRHGEIGVDVQRVWEFSSLSDAAASALNWNENKHLRTLPTDERARSASRMRAAKEAYARLRGFGSAASEHLHVSLIQGQHCAIEDADSKGAGSSPAFFSMATKPDADGKEYAVALASSIKDLPLVLYRVPEQMQLADPLETLPAQQVAPYFSPEDVQNLRYRKSA